MDPLVFTTQGLIPLSRLTVRDVVTLEEGGRVVATEYYLGEQLVRRGVWLDLWRPMEMKTDGS